VRDWRVSSEPSGSDHTQIPCLGPDTNRKKKWGHNPILTNWIGYRAELECQLKKALNRFNSKIGPEMASQFTSDAIKGSFEMNCPIILNNLSALGRTNS
jgi:hypothetical protein